MARTEPAKDAFAAQSAARAKGGSLADALDAMSEMDDAVGRKHLARGCKGA
jgi:hypothetical protein